MTEKQKIMIARVLSLSGALLVLGATSAQFLINNESLKHLFRSLGLFGIPMISFGAVILIKRKDKVFDERFIFNRLRSFRNGFLATVIAAMGFVIFRFIETGAINYDLLIIIGIAVVTKVGSMIFFTKKD